ncbi:MAG: RNA 2',3'-cyclic phosphodiesterase [Desulforhopalus sp.]
MIRLFVAIDIPQPICRNLKGMGGSIPQARAVAEDQLHLTLKFIGEIEYSRFLDIREALAGIDLPQFPLYLKGVGTFPPRGTPRVLWVGAEPANNITILRNSIERTLAEIGIARSKKKFTPHITIARLKDSPVRQLQQFLAGNAFLKTAEFTIVSFNLYSSKLTPKGAVHTLEAAYPLNPRED